MYDLSHIVNFATGIQNAVDNIFVYSERLVFHISHSIRPCLPSFLQLIIFWQANMRLLKQRIQINDKILNFQILLENGTRKSVSKDTDTNSMF